MNPNHQDMNIFIPDIHDYAEIADIYNAAIIPYHGIWSAEEKQHFTLTETAQSIAEQCRTRQIIAIRHQDKIAGYALHRLKNPDCHWISNIYIHPEFQRHGYGTGLLQHIEQIARQHNAKICVLDTDSKAEWAIRFYQKQGYADIIHRLAEFPFSAALDKPPVAGRPLLGKLLQDQ